MLNPEILTQILRQQLRPIQHVLDDPRVTEIMINPGGHVFVESAGVISPCEVKLNDVAINMAVVAVAKTVFQNAIANSEDSIVTASVDDFRIAAAMPPVSPDGTFISIRKHQDKSARPTLENLIDEKKALTQRQADMIVDLIINKHRNCIFAGATGSGKTTLINAILSKVPHHERILTIEDARELQVPVPNLVALVTDPLNKKDARTLVQLAMRARPDRLILGETRGNETFDLIRAFNSGHPGSMSSIHADSAALAMDALEMLFQMSLPGNSSISPEVARGFISKAVHMVVFCSRRTTIGPDGLSVVTRGVEEIFLVKGVKNGSYEFEDITHQ